MQETVERHCMEVWKRTRFIDERVVLKCLSTPLQMELSYIAKKETVEASRLCKSISMRLRKRLAMHLSLEMYCKEQSIYKVGDLAGPMFFVGKGLVQMSSPDPSNPTTTTTFSCKRGSHFGFAGPQGVHEDAADAIALTEIYLLTEIGIMDILNAMSKEKALEFLRLLIDRLPCAIHTHSEKEDIWSDTDSDSDSSEEELIVPVHADSLNDHHKHGDSLTKTKHSEDRLRFQDTSDSDHIQERKIARRELFALLQIVHN